MTPEQRELYAANHRAAVWEKAARGEEGRRIKAEGELTAARGALEEAKPIIEGLLGAVKATGKFWPDLYIVKGVLGRLDAALTRKAGA